MRATWKLPQERALPLRTWTERDVILEFNGPQLTTIVCDDALYLSVASDVDHDKIRWLRTRISEMEYKALLLGATTVRECILKNDILVVDTDYNSRPIAEVAISPELLNDDDVPGLKSFLPEEITSPNKQPLLKPAFFLNGPLITQHSVGFRVLSDIAEQIQRLWNAIGQTILSTATAKGSVSSQVLSETELRLTSLVPGSVGLEIGVSNEQVFGEIAASYSRLLMASGDAQALQGLLHTLKARVRSAFSDYLAVIQKHNVEVLARWSDRAAFVSPFTAGRISSELEYIGGEEEERFTATGHFVGFHIDNAVFEFQDQSDDQTKYQGRVSPRVLGTPNLKIVVGRATTYEVDLVLYSWSQVGGPMRQTITLDSVRQVSPPTQAN